MDYAIYDSIHGKILIKSENETVFSLKKVMEDCEDLGVKTDFSNRVFLEISEYFKGERKEFSFNFELKGTQFQQKVWEALLEIPYGETCTYKDIAKKIGNEKASRAVGLANNKNPLHIIVPCHRVIGANKKLVGYAGGLLMKEALLKMESENK